MKRKTLTDLLWQILLAVFVIVSDRAVKVYIIANCRQGEVFGELPGVADFLYVRNTGAAFSLFNNSSAFMTIISILTFGVLGFFVYAYVKLLKLDQFKAERIALIFLFGGAAGNLIDRVMYQFVVDFIYVKIIDFPTFNVADIYITCTVIYIIFRVFYCMIKKKESFIDVIL